MQKMRPLGRAFCVVFACGLWRASIEHNRKVALIFLCPTLPNTTARRVGFMRRIFGFLLFYVWLCASPEALAFLGKVIAVADGDTVTVLTQDNQKVKIRLAGIDTPERSQAFGQKAKQAISSKIFGKTIEIKEETIDRYGRTVANLYLGSRWINLEMVEDGFAWHYKKYSKDRKLASAEVEAKQLRKGLWSDPNAIPPWEYRRGGKKKTSSPRQPIIGGSYWLNTKSGTRHNEGCRYYNNTKSGRPCSGDAGKACGICGG